MIELVKRVVYYGNWVQMTSPGPEAGKQCEVVSDFSFCLISVLMVDRGRNWSDGWDCRAEQRPSVIERGVYVQLELHQICALQRLAAVWGRSLSRARVTGDWPFGTPDRCSAFHHKNYREIQGRGIHSASTCPKIPPLHFKILGKCFKCKFYSTYVPIHMQIFLNECICETHMLQEHLENPSWK